jgi:hypothetical protein
MIVYYGLSAWGFERDHSLYHVRCVIARQLTDRQTLILKSRYGATVCLIAALNDLQALAIGYFAQWPLRWVGCRRTRASEADIDGLRMPMYELFERWVGIVHQNDWWRCPRCSRGQTNAD